MSKRSKLVVQGTEDVESGRRVLVVHPFLVALWPVLFIYSQNLRWVRFSQTWTASAILMGSALVLLLLLAATLRSWMKAGALLSLLWMLFFLFGPVYNLLWPDLPAFAMTTESLTLMCAFLIVFAGAAAQVLRTAGHWPEITKVLNVVSLTLLATSAFRIGVYELGEGLSRREVLETFEISRTEPLTARALPDIYYIILDAYARADILEEVYGYDNSTFLNLLSEQGFYIADRGQANYAQTGLSLASSLNVGYLDDLASLLGRESGDHRPLKDLIQESAVVRFLRSQGYTIVSLSGYDATDLRNADVDLGIGASWNELETRLVCSTPIPWLSDAGGAFDLTTSHRQGILYALEHLPDTAYLPGPHFVFAHVLAPHGPFVFDEDGNTIDYERQFDLQDGLQYDEQGRIVEAYRVGYTGQLAFISTEFESVLQEIAARSSRPYIVVLQSDHGPGYPLDLEDPGEDLLRQKMAILNAYLFPERDYANLYQEITPVNTFRVIFNQYLGTELEMLEDESYYSTWTHPYRFVNVTDLIRSNGDSQPPE